MASKGSPNALLDKLTTFLAVGLRRAGHETLAIHRELEIAFRQALLRRPARKPVEARPAQASPDPVAVYRQFLEDHGIDREDAAWLETAIGVLHEAIGRELVWRGKPPEAKKRWEIIRTKGPGALPPPKPKKQRPPKVQRPRDEPQKPAQEEKPKPKPKPTPAPSILIDHLVVCQMLGIRPNTWRNWVAKGLVPTSHSIIGSRFFYRRADIEHYIRVGIWPPRIRFRGYPALPESE
jgi:hypothetical protein